MNLSVGIVGLPNVGKSTLFNALLKKQQALAANYPFATIEPNVGIVPVSDERLEVLANIIVAEAQPSLRGEDIKSYKLPPIKTATVEFVDIAGLVKGASEGAGLGNRFLSHIREVSIIAHVVRVFEDPNIIKEGAVDPKSDYDTINTELMLADLSTLQKTLDNRKLEPIKKTAFEKAAKAINEGKPIRGTSYTPEEHDAIRELSLLSSKHQLIVLNVSESAYNPQDIDRITAHYAELLDVPKDFCVVICAQIEAELAALDETEQKQYLKDLGLEASGLERMIKKAYEKLGLISFLTAGEKEVKAWTIIKGTTADIAAGTIHTDFVKHFIKAEIVPFDDFVAYHGWKGVREKGKAQFEGRDYVMRDGDVVEFKIGK